MNRVTDKQVDSIKASALDERRLLERALLDAVQSFGRFMLDGRTPHESLVLLESWKELFESEWEETAMSYYGVEHFDHHPSEHELASELRPPPPRPARRDRSAEVLAEWARHFEARLKMSERQTMKAAMAAVAVVFKEQRDGHQKTVLDLRCTIAALEQRLAVLEERKMVVFDKGAPGSPFRVIEAA